ncbi:MAG TPA: hypothetical protein VLK30_10565 [Candidatus Limnocylindrales bacterium]|nr:hypothetical protein [Candidatus Limnocylindrales bacterium]
MNYFEQFLELKLRQMLDPVVATTPPRRRAKRPSQPTLVVVAPIAVAGQAIPVAEPVVVTLAVVTSPQL